jgi:hypothetical protein
MQYDAHLLNRHAPINQAFVGKKIDKQLGK